MNNVDVDEAREIKAAFIAAKPLRKQLINILDNKIKAHYKAQFNRTNYEDANWGFAQADSMGYCRALEEMKSILQDNQDVKRAKRGRGRPKTASLIPVPLDQEDII